MIREPEFFYIQGHHQKILLSLEMHDDLVTQVRDTFLDTFQLRIVASLPKIIQCYLINTIAC